MSCKMGKYSGCASGRDADASETRIIDVLMRFRMSFGLRTDELCHRVVLSLRADGSCDAVVLQDGQEELNKV